MPDSKVMLIRHTRYFLFLLALYVVGWGFTSYQDVFLGLILGTALSYYNHWFLYRKVKKLGEIAANGGRMMGIGTVSRMALAVLAVMIATKYPEYLHLYAVIIGIVTSYIVIIIDSFVRIFTTSGEER
ncbi:MULTISPECIES: ATP synthase subunit I [Bacillus]|uniref:ATP synthase subunit I n=1 Tax=Bacillus TaxID=1386 RepID=UPI000BB8BFFC|nr:MULTISPECIES: ATP synthase subunit I [Bacillus]